MKPRSSRGHPENAITIHVQVTPGAHENAVAGLSRERIKIRVRGRAVEGAANEALIRYLSELFGVAKTKISIVRGHTSRLKSLSIEGNRHTLEEKLNTIISAVRDS